MKKSTKEALNTAIIAAAEQNIVDFKAAIETVAEPKLAKAIKTKINDIRAGNLTKE